MLLGNKYVKFHDYLSNHVYFKSSNKQENIHIQEFPKGNSQVQLHVSIEANSTTKYDASIVMYNTSQKCAFNWSFRYIKIAKLADCSVIAIIGKCDDRPKTYKLRTEEDFFLLIENELANATSPFDWIIAKIESKFFYYLLYYLYRIF